MCGGGDGMHPGETLLFDFFQHLFSKMLTILHEFFFDDIPFLKCCFCRYLQEKTDEITNKFLDKRREIHSYQSSTQPMTAIHIDEDLQEIKEEHLQRHSSSSYNKSPKKRIIAASPRKRPNEAEADLNLTEDEMSVNSINR